MCARDEKHKTRPTAYLPYMDFLISGGLKNRPCGRGAPHVDVPKQDTPYPRPHRLIWVDSNWVQSDRRCAFGAHLGMHGPHEPCLIVTLMRRLVPWVARSESIQEFRILQAF